MSNHTSDTATPADHVPHVLPLKVYLGVFAMLLVFTAITVGVSYIDLGPLNLAVALLVASAKALMVATIFMHLAFDKKFNVLIIASAFVFVAILITITMQDTETRGTWGGPTAVSAERALDPTQPFVEAATKSDQAILKQWAPEKAAK